MKQYFTGFFTAVCLTASVFIFMGSQNKNLGHIEAESITITSELGTTRIVGGGVASINNTGQICYMLGTGDTGSGYLQTFNEDGKETAYLGTGDTGSGILRTRNADGKETAYLGTGDTGSGYLKTFNVHEKMTGYFGTDKNNDGIVLLMDRYGDRGWGQSGKQ